MKLVVSVFLLMSSIAAVEAQTANVNLPAISPLGGYAVIYPQAPLVTIRFDGNSEDIAKVITASRPGPTFNHDGSAFKGYVRSTSSESYYANAVDYDQREKNVAEYKRNVKSGKWVRFVNGE
jgi:hypothetical protein